MNPAALLAGLLALAAVLGIGRLLWWQRRAFVPARRWRLAVLLLAQPLYALLLFFALMPPTIPGQRGTLTVLTAGASAPRAMRAPGDVMVALPEAPATPEAEKAPDLATALRRHPGMRQLHVVGAGLEARDLDAARGHGLRFDAAPLPRGLVRLDAPAQVAPGAAFVVTGRVHAMEGGSVELLDPAGRRLDAATPSAAGDFSVGGTARAAGLVGFRLRISDRSRGAVETVDVPIRVAGEPPPRVLVLAAAPNPELKYLRRWMVDAGMRPHVQIQVGAGMQLGDAPLALNAATFERFDLLVLDDRSWAALGDASRAGLAVAVRAGLGVLLRVEGPLPDSSRRQLRQLGLTVSGGGDGAEVRLAIPERDDDGLRARQGAGSRDAPVDTDAVGAPALNRRTLRDDSDDAASLLRDVAGKPLASWRAEGRGRIGVWPLTDTYRLTLAGRDDLHAELWSDAFATLARARDGAAPVFEPDARAAQRVRICGITGQARVTAPGGAFTTLLPDPASGASACAGYWPMRGGWHRLQLGEAEWPFAVRAPGEAPGLRAMALREATRRLVGDRSARAAAGTAPERRGSAWPWWLAWLCFAGALWWFERSRLGRPVTAGASRTGGVETRLRRNRDPRESGLSRASAD